MLIFRELPQTFFYIFDKIVDSLQFHFVTFLQFSFIILQVILQNKSCAHLCFPDARMCISVICSQSCVVSYPQKRMAASRFCRSRSRDTRWRRIPSPTV